MSDKQVLNGQGKTKHGRSQEVRGDKDLDRSFGVGRKKTGLGDAI